MWLTPIIMRKKNAIKWEELFVGLQVPIIGLYTLVLGVKFLYGYPTRTGICSVKRCKLYVITAALILLAEV